MTTAAPEPTAAAAADAITVGLLVPLTGENAAFGRALLNAAELALFETGGDRFRLLPRDSGATPEAAAAAAADVIANGARLILGPLLAASVRSVAPIARAAGVHVIAFSTDRTVAGDGVFLLGFSPRQQVARIVRHLREAGIGQVAALVPQSPYGLTLLEELRRETANAGIGLGPIEIYEPGDADLTPEVRRLALYEERQARLRAQIEALDGREDEAAQRARVRLQGLDTIGDVPFAALFLPEGGARLRAIVPLIPYFDIDIRRVRLIGTGLWDDPGLLSVPELQGAWFASPPPASRSGFERRYESAFGQPPPRPATLAYDAVALAATLARGGQDYDAVALMSETGFAGVDGIFRFAADGIAERGLAVLEIATGGFRLVGPAPTTFGPGL